MTEFVPTICPYCGAGCGILLIVKNGKLAGTKPWYDQPVSRGTLCIKGQYAHEFVYSPYRLKKPLVKVCDSLHGTTWPEALKLVAEKLAEFKDKNGHDALAFLSSAKCTNEENYLLQKFVRIVIGTHNIDHCARLCHASTVTGLGAAFANVVSLNTLYNDFRVKDITR